MDGSLFWNSIITVTINDSLKKLSSIFAKGVISTVDYSDTNQSNKEKIFYDHYISKIGEGVVFTVLKTLPIKTIIPPDFRIYEGQEKSWKSDLIVDDDEVGVKSQSVGSAVKYGISWVFQNSSLTNRTDPILTKSENICIFCLIDEEKSITYVYPPKRIKDIVFSDPVIQRLKGYKKVVYAKENFTESFEIPRR